jgi:hypothetical protein
MGTGACIVARDEFGNVTGMRQPQSNLFIDQALITEADITVSQWQGDTFNVTAKIRKHSID